MLCLSHGSITKKPALRNLWHQQDIIVHALATEFAGSLNWQRAKLQFLDNSVCVGLTFQQDDCWNGRHVRSERVNANRTPVHVEPDVASRDRLVGNWRTDCLGK
jgi:hypothetical protein